MENQELNQENQGMDELSLLKQRANMLGLTYSNNIGIAALKAKIDAKLAGDEEQASSGTGSNALEDAAVAKMTFRQRMIREQTRLVRVRIQNMDPKKKDLPGEIITVANRVIGTIRKFVPFGEATENGYHIPYCIYQMLEARRFLNVRTRKGKHGTPVVETTWAREFAIEILDPLTKEELAELAKAQIAAGSTNSLAD